MAVREFNGTSDNLIQGIGAATSMAYGTAAMLVKFSTVSGFRSLFQLHNSGNSFVSSVLDTTNFSTLTTFYSSGSDSGFVVSTGIWYLVVIRKATGTATPRYSVYNYTAGTWTHANHTGGAEANGSAPGAGGRSGFAFQGSSDFFGGRVAARAAWANTLPWTADASGDSALVASGLKDAASSWLAAAPSVCWFYNQAAVTTAVPDSATGGAGTQISRSGTTVITGDDPPGFSFGGATTLTVANAAQAQHPTSPALAQVHNLVVANAAQVQHPTSPALTQVHSLAPVGVSQAQSASATTVSVTPTLAVANAGQAQAVVATTLAQAHSLAVANAGQAQGVVTTALVQAHQLAVTGEAQDQHPTSPALAQAHNLVVAGVGQAQSAAPTVLTQTHILTMSGAAQAQHPASLTLSGPGTLAVAGVSQVQAAGPVTLTQAHNLAVSSISQAQHPATVVLSVTGALVVAGVQQVQTAQPVVLTQAHQLVVASAVQGESVAPTALTQDHQLAVTGPLQGQAIGSPTLSDGAESLELGNWLTLGDLMDARATHEQIMIDQISVRHPGMIEGVFDPDLGYAPATPREPHYAGKATVQARQISAGQISPAGLGTLTQLGYAVHGPVGTTIDQAAPDDVITVTDSADPRYIGLVLIVRNVESSSFVTARRLICTVYEPSTP